jgi:hypothetical protein
LDKTRIGTRALFAAILRALTEYGAQIDVPACGGTGRLSMSPSSKANAHSSAISAISATEAQEAVSQRARAIYEKGGKLAGRDLENWMPAEAEIVRECSGLSVRMLALVVRVDGVQYVGEYNLACANGYTPGEFASGDPVPVRFVGNRMLVKRPNGKVLETIIAKKVGGTSAPICTA